MLSTILFIIFALMSVIGAVLMITRRNPLVSALFLILTFCSLAGIYFMLNAELIAIFQIIIYAGAIMVLFIFVIMLLNLSHLPGLSFRIIFTKLLGTLLAVLLLWTLVTIFGPAMPELGSPEQMNLITKENISTPDTAPETVKDNNVKQFGWALFSTWVYPFEIISIILLVGVVGAVLFSKREVK